MHDTHRSFSLLVLFASVMITTATVANAQGQESAGSAPPEVRVAYERLSASIRTANMPQFMKIFHRDFIFEGVDGAAQDRGPWRRRWLEIFDTFTYSVAACDVRSVAESTDEQVILSVRRVYVRAPKSGGDAQLSEVDVEDTWLFDNDVWTLVARRELEVTTMGSVAIATAECQALVQLDTALRAGTENAERDFWKSVRGQGPVVEALEGGRSRVTFLFRGEDLHAVSVRGGGMGIARPLVRLDNSGVWFRSEEFPQDAAFTYVFQAETRVQVPALGGQPARAIIATSVHTDHLNPRTAASGASLLVLSNAAHPAWDLPIEGRPSGAMERVAVRSAALEERRFVSVYTPPGYTSSGARYPVAVLLDQSSYDGRKAMRTALDNLITDKKIPALVVVLVHSRGSSSGLAMSPAFLRFLGGELVPWIKETHHVMPRGWITGGTGLGGVLATLSALSHPEVFGGLVVDGVELSPALEKVRAAEAAQLRVRIGVAELESVAAAASSAHVADLLRARGFDVKLTRKPTDVHAASWRRTLAAALEELLTP